MLRKTRGKRRDGHVKVVVREVDARGLPSLEMDRVKSVQYKVIGGSQPVPLFRFTKALHQFRMQVPASAFKVKSGLTGSQIKGAAAAYSFAFNWSIGDLPFNFAGLFDQFRMPKVVLRISASNNTNATGAGARLYVVTDYDNSTALGSAAAAQTYQNCQVIRGSDTGDGESLTVELTPHIPITTNAGNMIVPAPWQDLAVTTNSHYGVKGWYATSALTDPVWDVDAQYWIECMNTQ